MFDVAQAPEVGRRIREARIAADLTQSELAAAVDQATRTIQSWEAAERVPRIDALTRVASTLGRPVAWFYEPTPEAA